MPYAEAISGSEIHLFALCISCQLLLACVMLCGGRCCRPTISNGGIPKSHALESKQHLFGNREDMKSYAEERTKLDDRADTRLLRLFANRPWKEAGETDKGQTQIEEMVLTPDSEFFGGQAFPFGETRIDSTLRMTLAFWKFMRAASPKAFRFVGAALIAHGILGSLSIFLAARALSAVAEARMGEHPDAGRLHFFAATAAFIVVAIIRTQIFWAANAAYPFNAWMRILRLRAERKFSNLTNEDAKNWPAGRCTAFLSHDVPRVMAIWDVTFNMLHDIASAGSALMLACLECRRSLDIVVPVFAITMFAVVFDSLSRSEIIKDMARGERVWCAASEAISTSSARRAREKQNGLGRQTDSLDWVVYWQVTSIAENRRVHAWFVVAAASEAPDLFFRASLGVLSLCCGEACFRGSLPLRSLIAILVVMSVCIDAMKKMLHNVATLHYHLPALVYFAHVMNLQENDPKCLALGGNLLAMPKRRWSKRRKNSLCYYEETQEASTAPFSDNHAVECAPCFHSLAKCRSSCKQ